MSGTRSHWSMAFAVAAVATVLVLLLHIAPFTNSMIDFRGDDVNMEGKLLSREYLQLVVDSHRTEPAFAKRKFTTAAIDMLTSATGLGVAVAFTIVQFFFLFLSAIALYALTRTGLHEQGSGLRSMLVYFLSFTVLFAWFMPIYTYDEGIQYVLLFASVTALVKDRIWISAILLSLAVLARENSLFLLPGMLIVLNNGSLWPVRPAMIFRMLPLTLPVLIVVVHRMVLEPSDKSTDLLFEHNFMLPAMAVETLAYWSIVILPHGYVLYLRMRRKELRPWERSFTNAFLITLLINTMVIFLLAQAREARLFALPLIFAWPILGEAWRDALREFLPFKNKFTFLRNWSIIPYLLTLVIGILFILHGFTMSDGLPSHNFFREYMIVMLVLLTTHIFMQKGREDQVIRG